MAISISNAVRQATNIPKGVVEVITGFQSTLSAVNNVGNSVPSFDSDGFSSPVKTFELVPKSGGPPYQNVLEEFASYVPLWTMAVLEADQLNDPYLYRGNPNSLKNVVFSSAGRFDDERVITVNGSPEYFVNNFDLAVQVAMDTRSGNTSPVQKIDFELYEPYSMGFFLQSLSAGSLEAGYSNYNEAPFLLKLEFVGFKQDGSVFSSNELLTRYFVVFLKNVTFTVNEGGSNYRVECVPYTQKAMSDVNNMIFSDVKLSGETVEEVLSVGAESLCNALNKLQLKSVFEGQQDVPDEYAILFPEDWSDNVGLNTDTTISESLYALSDPNAARPPKVGIPAAPNTDFGSGKIGRSNMGFKATDGGTYNFAPEADAIDENGIVIIESLRIDPKSRTFSFPSKTQIHQIITQIIQISEYAKSAVDEANLDNEMRFTWFRIDTQIQLKEFDAKRGRKAKKLIYRVVPYKIHSSVFSNTTAAPAYEPLRKICAKQYNYIFTGQNNDVLRFDIQINNLFNQGRSPVPLHQTADAADPNTQTPTEESGQRAEVAQGNNPAALGTIGSVPVQPDPNTTNRPTKGGAGVTTVAELVAAQLNNAILNNGSENGDLIKIDIEILGDPYYLCDVGHGNYLGEPLNNPYETINAGGSMNFAGTEVFINIVFRTPLEPNLGLTGSGGLYNFPQGETENPYSGLYKVIRAKNTFQDGTFKQTLTCNRMKMQPQDFPEGYKPDRDNIFAINTSKKLEPKSNIFDAIIDESSVLPIPVINQRANLSSGFGIGAALSAGTSNEDLTYRGDDNIVWDRINNERLGRGLPGLASIGSPRPAD